MDLSGVRIVIPHRGLRDGKARLADGLAPEERVRLSEFMLRRVAKAARCVVADVRLISPDPSLARVADPLGLGFMRQVGGTGMNRALTQASDAAIADGVRTLCVISADLPEIEPDDVRSLLRQAMSSPEGSVTIAPDAAGSGTNALVLRPPGVIPFMFGAGSRVSHVHQAALLVVPISVVTRAGLALDIDTPSDLAAWSAAHLADWGTQAIRTKVSSDLSR